MYPPPQVLNEFPLDWMYAAVSEPFEIHMGSPEQVSAFKHGGFYTVSPESGLRLVILNTNICYKSNFWLPFDPIDPYGHLQWFSNEMSKAEVENENVIILAHIPPGSGEWWSHWSDQYDRVINRYAHLIRFQLFGHWHSEFHIVSFDREGPFFFQTMNLQLPEPSVIYLIFLLLHFQNKKSQMRLDLQLQVAWLMVLELVRSKLGSIGKNFSTFWP